MKSGKVAKEFSAKDGRKVILRTPRWEDLDDLLDLINSLVEENADLIVDEKLSREQEADWLSCVLSRQEKKEIFFLVAEVEGRVVASSDLHSGKGSEKHVGIIGIAIKRGYRDTGIGTCIIKVLIEQAKRMGLQVLILSAYATNIRAIHVYESLGFIQVGRIPKKHFRRGKYIDEIIMSKSIE